MRHRPRQGHVLRPHRVRARGRHAARRPTRHPSLEHNPKDHRTAASSENDCDAFPIVVRSPMTIVGACEDARCVIDGGARVATAKTRGRPSCDAAGAPALFAVEAGGDLTLEDVDLADACNDVDGAGGAVLVRGGVNAGACGGPAGRQVDDAAGAGDSVRRRRRFWRPKNQKPKRPKPKPKPRPGRRRRAPRLALVRLVRGLRVRG